MTRNSGILLHITSLPSPYGIGTLGKEAYRFIDFLKAAGQSHWQVLPVGPVGYGNSPYQCYSTFAGNPYLIDLDLLVEDKLLKKAEVAQLGQRATSQVDFESTYKSREPLFRLAFSRFVPSEAYESFCTVHKDWLEDYAFFMAIKGHFDGMGLEDWPVEGLRLRQTEALDQYRSLLKTDIAYYRFLQYLFFHQWALLRSHAQKSGIKLIGDLPIYVSLDSADVWASPESFWLDENRQPVCVAGVPPDYFSETGQLWGNPLYNWSHMRESGYKWWIDRLGMQAMLFDMVRIDHFRGFESYWAVPFGETTAMKGKWLQGPGMDLISRLQGWFKDLEIIAEDLGILTPAVEALLAQSGYPGMKVLQFAFNPTEPSDYLPHNHKENCVVYTGTHDNNTSAGWLKEGDRKELAFFRAYMGVENKEKSLERLLCAALGSVARLCVIPMQDHLALGSEARMNIPATVGKNWGWRLLPSQTTTLLAKDIAKLCKRYQRFQG